ncbi:hypothetical protein WR25_03547 [Diploscapter pachys]|uniref:MARVEL domain-containing protein n=1 Tax=Diploscapter pachys TaxID=2018661 RepID=A0A2A2K4K0_9BILA|nr:hypothetical protein WR25_03547 [Diploscapter pachys]
MRILSAFCTTLFCFINPGMYYNVIILCLLHLVLTCLSLYAIYSCRPGFLKAFLVNIFVSLAILLQFFSISLAMYWHFNTKGQIADRETTKRHLRNVYVSGAFLVFYVVWIAISYSAYKDTCRLRADFMYWIVEERLSQQCRHNVSIDRSRSSKGSKCSNRSVKSEQVGTRSYVHRDRKYSLVNATLSVPL